MKFLDSNCCLGNLSVPLPKSIESAEEMTRIMEMSGVSEALVYHAYSREYDPAIGNRKLLKEISGYEHLFPCWILLPHYTEEMPPPEKLVEEMEKNNVRAARIFPKTQNWTLAEWSAGPLLKALEEKAIPASH